VSSFQVVTEDMELACAIDESYTELFLVENFNPHVN